MREKHDCNIPINPTNEPKKPQPTDQPTNQPTNPKDPRSLGGLSGIHWKLFLYSLILHLFLYSVCLLFSIIFFFILILHTRTMFLPSSLPSYLSLSLIRQFIAWFGAVIFSPGRFMGMTSKYLHLWYLVNSLIVENGVEFGSEFSKSNGYGHQISPDITDHLVFVSVRKLRQS